MAQTDTNLADRSGSLVESHKVADPRIQFFYFVLGGLLLIVVAGLAYQQLIKTDTYTDAERQQTQRRVIVPGPRGNIYDRHGELLVGNRPRFSVVLHLDELRSELRREQLRIGKNYQALSEKKDMPTSSQIAQIAQVSLVQRYLDQVNAVLHLKEKVDAAALGKHFDRELLVPYTLLNDLEPKDYARLTERLPVRSPLQVYTESARYYPHGSTAAHTLGFVGVKEDIKAPDFPGDDLRTFKGKKGTVGKDGLEKYFDDVLQGEAGGTIFRVDPVGYRVNPPLEKRMPVQGKNITTSLDLGLQQIAEKAIGDQMGAVVAIEVATGEVLVLSSKPDYNLADFSPRLSAAVKKEIDFRGAWMNLAVNGLYPPGSTFKILTTIAGLRRGVIDPDLPLVFCDGATMVANKRYRCDVGHGHHGNVLLRDAIAHSCDIYYYEAGARITAKGIADEGRRFHLDQRTGIELPGESGRMIIPDPEWKERVRKSRWVPGDTANISIGKGDVFLSRLQMACFTASVARNQVYTKPTLIHQGNRPPLKNESIGLTPEQRLALLDGMEGTTQRGSASLFTTVDSAKIPGVRIGGKTGTAQYMNNLNIAWFICFAPLEKPEIAMAVAVVGDTPGEDLYGGRIAAPIAAAVLKEFFERKTRPKTLRVQFKSE